METNVNLWRGWSVQPRIDFSVCFVCVAFQLHCFRIAVIISMVVCGTLLFIIRSFHDYEHKPQSFLQCRHVYKTVGNGSAIAWHAHLRLPFKLVFRDDGYWVYFIILMKFHNIICCRSLWRIPATVSQHGAWRSQDRRDAKNCGCWEKTPISS